MFGSEKDSEISLHFSSDGLSVPQDSEPGSQGGKPPASKSIYPTPRRRRTFVERPSQHQHQYPRQVQSQTRENGIRKDKKLQLPDSIYSGVFSRFDAVHGKSTARADRIAELELAEWVDRHDPDLPPAAVVSSRQKIQKGQSDLIYFQLEWFWYKHQKWPERCKMTILLAFVLIAVAHFVFGLYFLSTSQFFSDDQDPNPLVCTSPRCRRAAEYILDKIDMSRDPCNDFYKFVCAKPSVFPEATENHKLQSLRHLQTHRVLFFDFRRSQSLGYLFKKLRGSKDEYARKVLHFYQACLDRDTREKESFSAFLAILQSLKLDKMNKLKEVQVEELFALWLLKTPSSSFSLISRKLMADLFFVTYQFLENSFKISQSSSNAIVRKLRLLPFNQTVEIVKESLIQVRKELDLEDDEELETMAKDVTCIEINGGVKFSSGNATAPDKISNCETHGAIYRDQMNKFGSDQKLLTGFSYEEVIRRVIPVLSKESGLEFPNKIEFEKRAEGYLKKELVEDFFKKSTKRRVARFLQWILYRLVHEHLTWGIFLSFMSIPVPRYTKTWEFQCLDQLYSFFPEITLLSFLEANNQTDKKLYKQAALEQRLLYKTIQLINQQADLPELIQNCSNFDKVRAAEIRQKLADMTFIYVNSTEFLLQDWFIKELTKSFEHTPAWTVDISKDHLTNVFRLSLWSLAILKEKYRDTRSAEFRKRSFINSINAFTIYTDSQSLYPPNCLLEQPYFDNDMFHLNLAGYGAVSVYGRFQHFLYVIYQGYLGRLPKGFLPPKYLNFIDGTFFKEHERMKKKLVEDEIRHFTTVGSPEQLLHLNILTLEHYLGLQLAIKALVEVQAEHIAKYPSECKVFGGPLSKFTCEQLFYIQFVRNNCRDFTLEELELLKDDHEGPVIYNVVLGNNGHFLKTWKCSTNSRMRRSGAMNLFQTPK